MPHRNYSTLLRHTLAMLLLLHASLAQADKLNIVLYPGYGTPQGFILEGRVIEARHSSAESTADSRFANVKRSARRLVNDEQANIAVHVKLDTETWVVESDAEGYFRVEASAPQLSPGWHSYRAESKSARAQGQVLLVPVENTLGLISDLDDTILVSNVTDKSRLLKNTFLKNYTQRLAVPGAAAYYAQFTQQCAQPISAPIFYLSASPRQLHSGIQTFLDRNAFPPGVLITKKVTNDAHSEPLLDQVRYKTAHIERLLATFPAMRFLFIGDDGEHDPEIYRDIQKRFPTRITQVMIRRVHPDPVRPRYPEQAEFNPSTALESRP